MDGQPTDTDCPIYKTTRSLSRGTHVVVNGSTKHGLLPAGVCLWKERPFACVIQEGHQHTVCHACWTSLPPKQDVTYGCKSCQWTAYCSKSCSTRHRKAHARICSVLSQDAPKIAAAAGVTVTRVRLLMLCLFAVEAEAASQGNKILGNANTAISPEGTEETPHKDVDAKANAAVPVLPIESSTYEDTLTMVSHETLFTEDQLNAFRVAAEGILRIMPAHRRVLDVADIVRLACLIDTNSFGVALLKRGGRWSELCTSSTSAQCPKLVDLCIPGYGIFPKCARLNHSCYPSCHVAIVPPHQLEGVIDPLLSDPVLQMRTIRPVPLGEELTDSYTDLYCTRWTRRKELLKTKHFVCHCDRCQEPLAASCDRYLAGIVCPLCTKGKLDEPSQGDSFNWSRILYNVASYVLDPDKTSATIFPQIQLAVLDIILPDFLELAQLWTTPQTLTRTPSSFVQEVLLTDVANTVRYPLYDGAVTPVLLPTEEHSLELSSEAEALVLRFGNPPTSTQCERCGSEFPVHQIIQQEKSASALWSWLMGVMESGKPHEVRRSLALFLRQMIRSTVHPFHVWAYRASQFLVDAVPSNIKSEGSDGASVSEDSYVSQTFLDFILLRHHLACQMMAFPLFHEEICLTFRVLVHRLIRLDDYLEKTPANVNNGERTFNRTLVRAVRMACMRAYAMLCEILYHDAPTSRNLLETLSTTN